MGGYSSLVPRTHPFQYARFYFSCCDIVLYSLFFLISLLLWSIWSMINHFLSQQPRKEEKKKKKTTQPRSSREKYKSWPDFIIKICKSTHDKLTSNATHIHSDSQLLSNLSDICARKTIDGVVFLFFFLLIIGHWFIWIFIFFFLFFFIGQVLRN